MNQMQKAINNKSVIHLSFLNELDYSNIEPTAGQNIIRIGTLAKTSANSMFLRVFYRTINNRKKSRLWPRRCMCIGLWGDSAFGGTTSGFFNFRFLH